MLNKVVQLIKINTLKLTYIIGFLIRLHKIDKQTLYQVFTLRDPKFVQLILRIYNHLQQKNSEYFLPKESNLANYEDMYNQDKLLIDIQQLFNFTQNVGKINQIDFGANLEQQAYSKIRRKLRVTRQIDVMDCFTFSRDFIDNLDNLLDNFYFVAKKQLFSHYTLRKVKENMNDKNIAPHWLTRNVYNKIQDWVVGYFEIHIIKFSDIIYSKLMFQQRESFIDVWKSLEETQKDKMISYSLNIIDQFDINVFKKNCSTKTVKKNNMNNNEILFKLLLSLNNQFDDDIEEQKDIQSIKQDLKQKCKNLIFECRKNLKEHNFIKSSISFNLKMALNMNHFFQNFFMEDLQKLCIRQKFESKNEEVNKQNKKKKNRQRKKKKKNKNQQIDLISSKENLNKGSNQSLVKNVEESENLQTNVIQNNNNLKSSQQIYEEDLCKHLNHQENEQATNSKKNLNQNYKDKGNKSSQQKTLPQKQTKNQQEQNKYNDNQIKKDEQYSTENSFLNSKNYQIEANQNKIKKFEQNFQFKKLSNSNAIKNNKIQQKNQQNIVEIKINQPKNQLQLSRNSSQDQEQQDWYVQPKKNKRTKKNRNKRKRKKTKNDTNVSSQPQKSQNVLNIQLSKPINYLTKLTKWDEKEEQNQIQEKFLFQEEDQSEEEIKKRLRHKISKIVNQQLGDVLKNLIDQIENITKNQEQGRSNIKKRLNQLVKKSIKKNQSKNNIYNVYIQEYGSYATKILTPFSDIDLYVQFPYDINKETAIENLTIINQDLIQQKFIKVSKDILTATIPVLKIVADPSIQYNDFKQTNNQQNVKVDLTVNLSCNNLLNSSYITTDFIKCSCSVYKTLKKNMIFMKYLFSIKQLNNAYLGGLNSYGLSLMYIAFLEIKKYQNNCDLFQILLQFFTYYGMQFDPQKIVIDLGYGMAYKYNPFISRGYYQLQSLQQIIVNDPTSVAFSNVTSTCTSWSVIQQYFQRIIQNYHNIIEYLFNQVSQENLKTLTENSFMQQCNELLKQKELCFQNMFQCDSFFLNPKYYAEQQQQSEI